MASKILFNHTMNEKDGDTKGTQKRQKLVQLCPSWLIAPAQYNKL